MVQRCCRCWAALLAGMAILAFPCHGQDELASALARLSPVFGEGQLYPRSGDEDIHAIARRFGLSALAVLNANQGDLLTGDELLLIPTEHVAPLPFTDGVIVNLAEGNLYVYKGGRPRRVFPAAIGRRGWETPTGEYTIVNKVKNPTWFPPSWALREEPVPPGPDNPLGDRWMGLSIKGYGIHATNEPSSVGLDVSHGCMRMYPEHAHELYEVVSVGTPVLILYRRIVFGLRPGHGVIYMAHYPDPYLVGSITLDHVCAALHDYGLDQIADMDAVASALQEPTGVPKPIAGSRTRLLVNGRQVRFALGPTRVGRDWLVPAGPLVKALRAELEIGPNRGYLLVKRGGHRIFYSLGGEEALANGQMVRLEAAPQLAAGYPLIPLRTTVTLLGGSVGWDETRRTILVWDGWGLGSFPRTGSPARDTSVEAGSFLWRLLMTGLERTSKVAR